MKRLFHYYPRLRTSFILLVIASAVVTVLDYVTSLALGNVTTGISTAEGMKAVTLISDALVIFILDVFVGGGFYNWVCSRIETYTGEETRRNILRKICALPVFSDALINRGGLYSLVTKDTETFQSYCSSILPALISNGISFLGALIFGLNLSPILCLLYFASLIGGIALQRVLAGTVEKAYQKTWQKQNAFFVQTENVVKNRIAFRTYQKESYGEDVFRESQRDFNKSSLASDMVAMPLKVVGIGCAIMPVIVLCFAGLWLTSTGRVSVSGLLSFYYFCLGSVPAQVHYVDYILMAKQASVSVKKVADFLTEKDEVMKQNYYDQETLNSATFHYPGTTAGVENVTLTLHKGEKVALIGKNGSGKTTLLHLMAGFLKPDSGEVQRMNSLLVPQDPFFFDGTIRENLCCGTEFSDQELEQALEKSEALQFVQKLTNRLDEPLLNNASNLSGGQKQRLAIARAILHHYDLYFFDESLSACDPLTADRIMHMLREELQDKTAVFILHQPELVAYTNRVICLADGHITFDGSRKEFHDRKVHYEQQ